MVCASYVPLSRSTPGTSLSETPDTARNWHQADGHLLVAVASQGRSLHHSG